MRPTRIADLVADRMWKARGEMTGPFLWEGGAPVDLGDRENALRDSEYDARIILPGDVTVSVTGMRFQVTVDMNDHSTTLERHDAYRVIRTWRAVQAAAMLEMLDPLVDLDAVRTRRGGDLFERLTAPLGNLMGYVPVRWPGQNVAEVLDETIAVEISAGRYRRDETIRYAVGGDGREYRKKLAWHRLRDGMSFVMAEEFTLDGNLPYMIVSHPDHGHVRVDSTNSLRAFKRRQSMAFAQALEGGDPTRLVHLPQTGNARIARIARICRDALASDPEMKDARGMPLLPLVQHHLPDLLRRHAAAARNAPSASLEKIDADLEKGVEIIRAAVDDGMRLSADTNMAGLREQLRFLELRHPENDEI